MECDKVSGGLQLLAHLYTTIPAILRLMMPDLWCVDDYGLDTMASPRIVSDYDQVAQFVERHRHRITGDDLNDLLAMAAANQESMGNTSIAGKHYSNHSYMQGIEDLYEEQEISEERAELKNERADLERKLGWLGHEMKRLGIAMPEWIADYERDFEGQLLDRNAPNKGYDNEKLTPTPYYIIRLKLAATSQNYHPTKCQFSFSQCPAYASAYQNHRTTYSTSLLRKYP